MLEDDFHVKLIKSKSTLETDSVMLEASPPSSPAEAVDGTRRNHPLRLSYLVFRKRAALLILATVVVSLGAQSRLKYRIKRMDEDRRK